MKKILSIIIPIYNVKLYIEECLNSIFNNSNSILKKIELILIDDKSSDDSIEIAMKVLKKANYKANIIQHKENLGPGGARNSGIKIATGKYITFIDSDDWYSANTIESMVTHLVKDSSSDIFVFGFEAIKNGKITWSYKPKKEIISREEGLLKLSKDEILPAVWIKIFKTKIVKDIQFLSPLYYQDIEYTFQAFQRAKKIKLLNESYICYRQDGISITRQKTKPRHVEDMSDILVAISNNLTDNHIISSVFFNRWAYLLKSRSLNIVLFKLALKKIDQFICNNKNKLDFNSSLSNSFFNRLAIECIRLNAFELLNPILNKLYIVENCSTDDTKPLISVIVPVYNAEKFISKFIESFENQKFKQFEIVFVDDCSSDESLSILNKKRNCFKNSTIIKTLKNFGAGTARNIGLDRSIGEYILFQDIDDLTETDSLQEFVKVLNKNDNPDLIINSFSVLKSDYSFFWSSEKIENLDKENYSGDEIFYLMSQSIINPAPWNKLFKRSVWDENEIYYTPFIHHQDLSTIPYACFKSNRVKILKKRLYNYYTNKNGVTGTLTDKHIYSIFYSLTSLLNKFNKDKNKIQENIKENFFDLSFDNIAWDFQLKRELFSSSQLTTFNSYYNFFIKYAKVNLAYLMGSEKALNFTSELINLSHTKGVDFSMYEFFLNSDDFKEVIINEHQINSQINLTLKGIIFLEKKYKEEIEIYRKLIIKKDKRIERYVKKYNHLPKWFVKIGSLFKKKK